MGAGRPDGRPADPILTMKKILDFIVPFNFRVPTKIYIRGSPKQIRSTVSAHEDLITSIAVLELNPDVPGAREYYSKASHMFLQELGRLRFRIA